MASLVKILALTRILPILGVTVCLGLSGSALAQCGAAGCPAPRSASFSPPPYTPPTSAQDVIQEVRRSAAATWQPDMNIPQTPVPLQLAEQRSTGSGSMQVSSPPRTWTNGDGLWQISPSGMTCQVSAVRATAPNASPCADAF